jgi:hypothetical protein
MAAVVCSEPRRSKRQPGGPSTSGNRRKRSRGN